MGEVRRTLIPQFSLRLILVIVAALAVVAFVASAAGRGWAWAAGVSVGLLAIVVAFVVYGALFAVAWLLKLMMRPWSAKRPAAAAKILVVGFVALANLVGLAHVACAVSGGAITLPMLGPNQANSTGLELTIDTTWVDSFGYRPVRVEVRSITGPVAADRVLSVRFRPRLGYTHLASASATQTVEIPAGSSAARATISVPQEGAWGSFELDVFEDGQYLEQLSIGRNAGWTSWSGTEQGGRSLPVILELVDAGRQTRVNIQIAGDSLEELLVKSDSKAGPQASPGSQGFAQRDSIGITDLPTQWIDYSGIDLVICSRAQLQVLAEQYPDQWRAIGQWLRNGGNLVVCGVGKNWEQVAELERAIGLVERNAKVGGEERDPAKRGWNLPAKALRKQELNETAGESARPDLASIGDAPFISRPAGLGMVAAIRGGGAFDGNDFNWVWLLNTFGPERWQWYQRWGLSLERENDDFWNFLIPGVGLAPVTQFQVFITLFMLAIGPVNYFVLRRLGKLNLLVVTVPAGALLVTLALIAVALLADGLGVRVRRAA